MSNSIISAEIRCQVGVGGVFLELPLTGQLTSLDVYKAVVKQGRTQGVYLLNGKARISSLAKTELFFLYTV
ncbi:hypothetical protein E2C01_084480 [Portunus trituberculatus]|uniref:Uncharacterized protein n=1 Tax=Portunus trituberculatus TaxID=210409 RepID=A0A5B7J9D3_PORTR|nr:hypothetical protein [Portunus trituberculatus]